ncbi:MAG: O-antigen ligase family protein, partial [Methylobacter sp.]
NGYGLIGLLAYLLFLWTTARTSVHPNKGLVAMFIFVAGLTFNMWEYFPQNAILMYLWGVVLGATGLQPSSSSLQADPAVSGSYYRRSS